MKNKNEIITCTGCGFQAPKGNLDRSCGNCFACTGCEIYICPECDGEIVVKPMQKRGVVRKDCQGRLSAK